MLKVGAACSDITPPLGVELAGFHKPAGKERKMTGVRQPTAARALVLRAGKTQVAIVVLDVLGFGRDFAKRIQQRVAKRTGIPSNHVRVCATHSHSAPSLRFLRQWGAVSPAYNALVETRAVQAVTIGHADLAPADLYLGKSHVNGGNHNRNSKPWKTDEEFTNQSGDSERWLDTMLHAL